MGGGRSLGARALLALISSGPMSRGDLAERLGLSAATTTRTVRPLIEAGLIEEQPPVEVGGPGRPTRLLAVVAGSATVAGVKLTADRLYAVLTDPLGEVLSSDSRPLTDTDAGCVTALIASVVAQLAQRSGRRPDAVGISLGAAVVGRRTVVVASFLGWRDVPLAAMVTEATGLPCVAANDVRAFAYAEARFGAGRGKDPFAMVTLGAGIGCGVPVARGRALETMSETCTTWYDFPWESVTWPSIAMREPTVAVVRKDTASWPLDSTDTARNSAGAPCQEDCRTSPLVASM